MNIQGNQLCEAYRGVASFVWSPEYFKARQAEGLPMYCDWGFGDKFQIDWALRILATTRWSEMPCYKFRRPGPASRARIEEWALTFGVRVPPPPTKHELRVKRFWARVVKGESPEACWNWSGLRAPFGYAISSKRLGCYGHRTAWILCVGPIPPGLCVLHHCDNPPCCNPAHLFLGTSAENAYDRHRKGRTHNQRILPGEAAPDAS